MDRLTLLKQLSFGARVAEEETAGLASYFVETDQWNRIFRGEIDIVRGEKGAGKSAIYALLVTKTDDFFDKNILLITAERPRGAVSRSESFALALGLSFASSSLATHSRLTKRPPYHQNTPPRHRTRYCPRFRTNSSLAPGGQKWLSQRPGNTAGIGSAPELALQ